MLSAQGKRGINILKSSEWAAWVSAAGTISATVAAVWLARRGQKVRLRMFATLELIEGRNYLMFKIANLADHDVWIEALRWKKGRGGTATDIVVSHRGYGSSFSVSLSYGDTASFYVWADEHPWAKEYNAQPALNPRGSALSRWSYTLPLANAGSSANMIVVPRWSPRSL